MLDNGKECGFANEIVAYIYDEMVPSERGNFESHLAGCTACTDEFAGISNARFSVFEWNREEFAELETPEIVIPYAPRIMAYARFFAGIREVLTLSGWSSAVMVAGALIICIGLGFTVMRYFGGSQQVAESKNPVVNEKRSLPESTQQPIMTAQAPQKEVTAKSPDIVKADKPAPNVNVRVRPERASMQIHRIREKNLTASAQPTGPLVKQKRNAPALTQSDDDDDKSLRLADLFDEEGS